MILEGPWWGTSTLELAYPRIFRIVVHNDADIRAKWGPREKAHGGTSSAHYLKSKLFIKVFI